MSLWPREGEHILDIATGTGWSARNVARFGATVTGVDFADDLLNAAKLLSAHIKSDIKFIHADAENLPFADGEFDGVISTFGVMFASNHESAANEISRVCKKGGRISLAAWTPGNKSFAARLFGVVSKYNQTAPPSQSPLEWGRPAHVSALLDHNFDLDFSEEKTIQMAPNGTEIWSKFYDGFGPLRLLADRLDSDKLDQFKHDFVALHDEFHNGRQVKIDRDYLLITGTRR